MVILLFGLLAPSGPSAHAQVDEEELEGVITGATRTPTPPDPLVHQERCGSFTGVAISVVATRVGPEGERVVAGAVEQAAGHDVDFCTRETLAVGEGRLSPTDAARAFRNRAGGAVEQHGDDVSNACIEIRLEDGEFTRVGNVAIARLRVDYSYKRASSTEDCHLWDGTGADFTEHLCGEAIVTATPRANDPAEADVVGEASARRCPFPV